MGTAGAKALKWEWAKAGEGAGGRRQADQCRWKVPVALGTLRVGVERRDGILMYLGTSSKYDLLEFSKTLHSQDVNTEAQVAKLTHFSSLWGSQPLLSIPSSPVPDADRRLSSCLFQAVEEEEMDPPAPASRVFCSRILSMVNVDDVNAIILAQKNM